MTASCCGNRGNRMLGNMRIHRLQPRHPAGPKARAEAVEEIGERLRPLSLMGALEFAL